MLRVLTHPSGLTRWSAGGPGAWVAVGSFRILLWASAWRCGVADRDLGPLTLESTTGTWMLRVLAHPSGLSGGARDVRSSGGLEAPS